MSEVYDMRLTPIPSANPGEQLLWSDRGEDADMVFLHPALNATYFGRDLTRMQILDRIKGSLAFSLFRRSRSNAGLVDQIAFARVVTDYASFGWLCDVVVGQHYRRRGYGTELMKVILAHPLLAGITINLGTRDAHAFYAHFGFEKCEQMMRRGK